MYTIAAVDRCWAIGKDGDQFCYLPEDLKRFKALTAGHAVILGRKTLATFPGGRPLAGRRNLVLSTDPGFRLEGAEVYPNLTSLLRAAPEDAFVIGGGSVYKALLPYCDTAYITKIDAKWNADTWFPDLDAHASWEKTEEEPPLKHEDILFHYVTYRRK